ncbi:MAG: hypothetical protein ACE5KH_05625 [Candidatus Geothermarchaeales archaeon]
MLVSLSLAAPPVVLVTVWYFFQVLYQKEIRSSFEVKSVDTREMGTVEWLLRLLDHSESLLGRLTRYTGWLFFMIILAVILIPFLFMLGTLATLQGGGIILTAVFLAGTLAFWASYFLFYYRVKHENDLWKERIAALRERERTLLGQ